MGSQTKEQEGADHLRRPRIILAPLLWASLIFFTSCFVIFTPEFFRLVSHVIPTRAAQTKFDTLWLVGGIFIIKGWHATEYAILNTLVFRQLQTRMLPRRALLLSLLICIAFAASDEWHQTFVPGRGGNVRDILIDTAGATMATAVIVMRQRRGD